MDGMFKYFNVYSLSLVGAIDIHGFFSAAHLTYMTLGVLQLKP